MSFFFPFSLIQCRSNLLKKFFFTFTIIQQCVPLSSNVVAIHFKDWLPEMHIMQDIEDSLIIKNQQPRCLKQGDDVTDVEAKRQNFLIVSDSTGVHYFAFAEEGAHELGPKLPLVEGSAEIPVGWAGSVAVCCQMLYVTVQPPEGYEGEEKGKILQYKLTPSSTNLGVAGEPPQHVVSSDPHDQYVPLALSCNQGTGDLYMAVQLNAADGAVRRIDG